MECLEIKLKVASHSEKITKIPQTFQWSKEDYFNRSF